MPGRPKGDPPIQVQQNLHHTEERAPVEDVKGDGLLVLVQGGEAEVGDERDGWVEDGAREDVDYEVEVDVAEKGAWRALGCGGEGGVDGGGGCSCVGWWGVFVGFHGWEVTGG